MSDTLITEGQTNQTADQQQTTSETTATETSTEETKANESEAQQQTDQGKDPVEKSSDEEGDKGAEESKDDHAPEKYEFKSPDEQVLNPDVIDAFSEVAKELNLSQDAAQKMIDKVAPVMQQQQADQVAAVHEAWATDAKADKEFGGDKLDENLAVAKKAIDTFGTPELSSMLNESGLGNHPEVIRMFYKVGKTIGEDAFVGGQPNPSGDQTTAQRMYPGMNP